MVVYLAVQIMCEVGRHVDYAEGCELGWQNGRAASRVCPWVASWAACLVDSRAVSTTGSLAACSVAQTAGRWAVLKVVLMAVR